MIQQIRALTDPPEVLVQFYRNFMNVSCSILHGGSQPSINPVPGESDFHMWWIDGT